MGLGNRSPERVIAIEIEKTVSLSLTECGQKRPLEVSVIGSTIYIGCTSLSIGAWRELVSIVDSKLNQ